MNLKSLSIFTGVLAILAVVTYFVKNADDSLPQDPRIGQTVIDRSQLEGAAKIVIESDGETITIAKDGSGWVVENLHSLPANFENISRLIQELEESHIERVASANPDRIADLGFGTTSIAYQDADGKTLLAIELGRETENGKQLIKYPGEDVAFIADDQFSLNSDPLSWVNKRLLTLERDNIRSATFTLANGEPLAIERDAADADWTPATELPEGKQLNQGTITRAINRFANVSFTQLAPLTDEAVTAASANSHHLSVTLEDGKSYTFAIGRRPEVKVTKEVETTNKDGETVTETKEEVETPAGPVYIHIESSDPSDPLNGYMSKSAFEVASYLFTNLPETTATFLEDIPTPEPEPEPVEETPPPATE